VVCVALSPGWAFIEISKECGTFTSKG
jgi:hypothetical protein